MEYNFKPEVVCATKFSFEIEDGLIKRFNMDGGCDGNLKGIKSLMIGRSPQEVITALDGITCGDKKTSCPDQIAKALKEAVS